MDLGAYFVTLEYVAMSAIFIALVFIFLYGYYGKDEEEEITTKLAPFPPVKTSRAFYSLRKTKLHSTPQELPP